MTAATSRVQINVPTYMPVDGQWQIVYPGSVVDLPPTVQISAVATTPVIAAAATPGTLAPHGQATPVAKTLRVR